jgi:hypothetical protein
MCRKQKTPKQEDDGDEEKIISIIIIFNINNNLKCDISTARETIERRRRV